MAKIGITVSADKKSISKVNHTVNDALKNEDYDSDFKLFLPHNQLREYYRVNTEDFKALVDSFKLS